MAGTTQALNSHGAFRDVYFLYAVSVDNLGIEWQMVRVEVAMSGTCRTLVSCSLFSARNSAVVQT